MKNILVFCNTYYQLLVAIQLQLTLKKTDRVSVIVTDESWGAETVADRLREADFFHGVFFLRTKIVAEDVNVGYKMRSLRDGVFGSLPADMPRDYICDELIGYNLDLTTHAVYAALYARNHNMQCNTMEEGLLSYDTPESGSGLLRMIQQVRRLLGMKNLRQSVRAYYCFNPRVYRGRLTPIAVPKLDRWDPQLRDLLRQVFLGDDILEPYQQRYIYLPCIYDMEGGEPIGELKLAQGLAQQVGKENLLVKVHPRDDAGKYTAEGLIVAANSTVPFEVLCILQDLSDKVLITTLSGSILNVSALLGDAPESYYAYPLCDLTQNPMARHFCGVIGRYLDPATGLDVPNIKILENYSEFTD